MVKQNIYIYIKKRVLKSSLSTVAPYFTTFYNKFIEMGIFPDILEGNTQMFQNYRPVSTLPCFGKIFEKVIIYTRLY